MTVHFLIYLAVYVEAVEEEFRADKSLAKSIKELEIYDDCVIGSNKMHIHALK